MLKQRSLLPSFGKLSPLGGSYNRGITRTKTLTSEAMLRSIHLLCSNSLSAEPSVFSDYIMGTEKFSSTEKYYQDNWCDHMKFNRINLPYTTGYDDGRYYQMWGFRRLTPAKVTPPVIADVEQLHYANLGKVGDELRAEAYWDMRPKFEGEVSMLNFLYELKDFRDIAKILTRSSKNPLTELKDALAGYKQSQKVINAELIALASTPTKRLAEGHLLNSFAIQPLISDLTSIFKQLGGMVSEAERKFADTGAGNTRYWSKQLDPVANLTSTGVYKYLAYKLGSKMSSTYTCLAKQRYSYTPRSKLNAFCTYWGLVPSVESVWNALPFSFLVDYFLSVGKSLNRMRTDPNVTAYSLSDLAESVITSYSNGYFVTIDPIYIGKHMGLMLDSDYYPEDKIGTRLVDGYECTFYKRVLDVQPYYGPPLPKLKVPKISQFTNMAALARCMF